MVPSHTITCRRCTLRLTCVRPEKDKHICACLIPMHCRQRMKLTASGPALRNEEIVECKQWHCELCGHTFNFYVPTN